MSAEWLFYFLPKQHHFRRQTNQFVCMSARKAAENGLEVFYMELFFFFLFFLVPYCVHYSGILERLQKKSEEHKERSFWTDSISTKRSIHSRIAGRRAHCRPARAPLSVPLTLTSRPAGAGRDSGRYDGWYRRARAHQAGRPQPGATATDTMTSIGARALSVPAGRSEPRLG